MILLLLFVICRAESYLNCYHDEWKKLLNGFR